MFEIPSNISVSSRSLFPILDKIENFMVDSCSALQAFLNPLVQTMNFSQMSHKKTKHEGGPRDRSVGGGVVLKTHSNSCTEHSVRERVSITLRSPLMCRWACKLPRAPPPLTPHRPSPCSCRLFFFEPRVSVAYCLHVRLGILVFQKHVRQFRVAPCGVWKCTKMLHCAVRSSLTASRSLHGK